MSQVDVDFSYGIVLQFYDRHACIFYLSSKCHLQSLWYKKRHNHERFQSFAGDVDPMSCMYRREMPVKETTVRFEKNWLLIPNSFLQHKRSYQVQARFIYKFILLKYLFEYSTTCEYLKGIKLFWTPWI